MSNWSRKWMMTVTKSSQCLRRTPKVLIMPEWRQVILMVTIILPFSSLLIKTLFSAVNCSLKYRMMDLRKCTNHPYLIEFPLTEDGVYYKIDDDIVESCGKMKVFQQLLTALLDRKHKVLVFSQMTRMLDILECYMEKQVYKNNFLSIYLYFPRVFPLCSLD